MKTIQETVQKLDPKKVLISALNTRQPTAAEVAELMQTLKATGQITPAIVRPHPKKGGFYELVAGARRKVACQALKITLDAVVREIPDAEFEDMILTDNLQREDPDPMQEAILIERRLAAGAAPQEIAARYGKSDTWLKRRMKLIALTQTAREQWSPGGIIEHFNTAMMEYFATLTTEEQDKLATDRWDTQGITSLEKLIDHVRGRSKSLENVTWLHDPVSFVPGCGPGCATNTAESLFPDPDHPCGTCINTACFRKREQLIRDEKLAEILDGRPITDFILFRSKGHLSSFTYQEKKHKVVESWQFRDHYTRLKKSGPESHLAIDLEDEGNPVVCHVKRKADPNAKPGSDGSTSLPRQGRLS